MIRQSLSETEVIRLVMDRDPKALPLFYDRYAALIYKISWLTVKDSAMAERILAETIQRVFHDIDTYAPGDTRFPLWLAGIVKKLALQEQTSSIPAKPAIICTAVLPGLDELALG